MTSRDFVNVVMPRQINLRSAVVSGHHIRIAYFRYYTLMSLGLLVSHTRPIQ